MIEWLLTTHLKDFRASTILDVGPGFSSFARIAAKVSGAEKIVYVDCNASVLDWQKKACDKENLPSDGLLITLTMKSMERIIEEFDLILCQEVLEHLTNAEEVLRGLRERLSDKGRIVITVPTMLSERWLKWLNSHYMKDEPFGHVREFDRESLLTLLKCAGLRPRVLLTTQPHFFIAHTWFFGTRMRVDGSTGDILTKDFRAVVFQWLLRYSRRFFGRLCPYFWGKLFPRNYFVIAERI